MPNTPLIRPPQHHGVFYPADPVLLTRQLGDCLAQSVTAPEDGAVKAIVVPHAGYDYSARVAALAYVALREQRWIQRIVMLAPNHQTAAPGGLIADYDAWATPLGEVGIDRKFIARHWQGLNYVATDNTVYRAEYSLEVQLPFIQQAFDQISGEIPIAPILLGECSAAQIAEILHPAWGEQQTLIIISSDLYHYLPLASARSSGMVIARAIEQNDVAAIGPHSACGYVALRGLMQLAAQESYYWRTLAVSHSGHNNRSLSPHLVGYGAFLLLRPSACRLPA